MSLGPTRVEAAPPEGGAAVNISGWIDEVSIQHGREDPSGQPEAPALTVDFTTSPDDAFPAAVDIGSIVTVTTTLAAVDYVRFRGRVTDMALGWDEAGEDTPEAGVGQLVAVGFLADLARRVVGAEPFPQELDGARVERVLGLAGFPYDPGTSDPGTVQILARDIDSQPAFDVIRGTASSAGGLLWTTRTGDIRYADSEHRRGTTVELELDSSHIDVTPTWRRNLEGLVNAVSVGYGVAAEGGDQPRYVDDEPASIAKWGEYAYSATTELAGLDDATAMGRLLLVRNSQPVWIMGALPVSLKDLSDADTATLLGLDMHGLILLTGLPAIAGAPTTAHVWVEGWREQIAWAAHTMELNVSGYCRTAPAPRWDDVSLSWTWDTMTPTLTWDDMTCLGPPPEGDRWTDVPASLRWDQIDPSVTWDTYT